MRHHEFQKDLHFITSIVEISFTEFVIILNMLNARMGYVAVQQAVQCLEHFDPAKDKHLRVLKTWMWLLVVAGCLHIAVSMACFNAFTLFLHLGWTVLSNQTCILSMNSLFGLYSGLMAKIVIKIKQDQQQVRIKATV